MDRSEPSLVPEWLRSTGGGCSNHQFSSSQTDGPLLALPKRTGSSMSIGNSGSPFSSCLDRTSSFTSQRSSSGKNDKNNYPRSYNSFNKSERDRVRERLTISDDWDAEYSYPLKSMNVGRIEKDTLMHSQSMVSRKQSDVSPQSINNDNGNGFQSVGSSGCGIQKAAFERDFPSLGLEEKPSSPGVSRVSSPGLSGSMQNVSIGNSAMIVVEGWTSALAEVPVGAVNNTRSSPALQPAFDAASMNCDASTSVALNMAEALVQAPARPHIAAPQPSGQRLEELAVLQSRRLIPMTPSMPKASALNSSNKVKPKTAVRSGESVVGSKNGQQLQQQSALQLGSQSLNNTISRADGSRISHAGMLVLKPVRENGLPSTLRDVTSPTTKTSGRAVISPSAIAPSIASDPIKNQTNSKSSTSELKTSASGLMVGSTGDRKLALAQAQSRSDFFNLMRKKYMDRTSSGTNSDAAFSSATMEKKDESKELASTLARPVADSNDMKYNGDACNVTQRFSDTKENDLSNNALIDPDEEEAAFLRSLGWEENAGDDEGLTEEEIKAFYEKLSKCGPVSKLCRGLQLKIPTQSEPPAACSGSASS